MPETFRSDVQHPRTDTPVRAAGSARRTTSLDMEYVDGRLVVDARCRDLVTDRRGDGSVHEEARLLAELAPGHVVERIDASGEQAAMASLVGLPAGRGFRAAAAAAVPDYAARSGPLFVLLDELPVAALISGFGLMYSGAFGDRPLNGSAMKPDICSGWAEDGFMVTRIRRTGFMPVPLGPPAPSLERDDDPSSWHELTPLAPGTMRRRRLIDVRSDGDLLVDAMFRDTYRGSADDEVELVLHEYSVTARVDRTSGTVVDCVADPRVLPWNECPGAAASAGRLVGHRVGGLRTLVAREFKGLGTCTHLNDLLRALGDLDVLVPLVAVDSDG